MTMKPIVEAVISTTQLYATGCFTLDLN